MKTKNVFFPSGELTLEGVCCYPDGEGKFPGIVLCHPHPLYGGSMDNSVIQEMASGLVKKSMIAFMFNFRGVGQSQGKFDGTAEVEDVTAAINWLASQPEVDASRIGLAGYSFGSAMALPEAFRDSRVKALALISPALMDEPKIKMLRNYTVPKLIICGDADEFVLPATVELMKRETAEPKQIEVIPGIDHFWLSYESMLAEKVATFFSVLSA